MYPLFVQEGKVLCSNIGSGVVADVTLGPTDYFGERSLMTEEPRAADVTALTHVECISISREVSSLKRWLTLSSH
jgi:cAMP-dependent protein kinase regulator